MNITFVTPSVKTGGGNRVFIELANVLCQEHDVEIVYSNNSQDHHTFSSDPRIRYRAIGRYASSRAGKLLNVLRLIRYINRQCKDSVVIFTDPLFSVFSGVLRVEHLYRFVQGDDYRLFDDGMLLGKGFLLRMYRYFCLRSYRLGHIRFIFNSRFTYDRFLEQSKRTDVPYRLVYPALNHSLFYALSDLHSGVRVCLVARKHPLKGLSTFIEMYRKLPDGIRRQIGRITLISHDDISGFDTSGMVICKPESDADIARIYNESDIFISPSWMEGFGLPPLEAMACGCACIISRSGGVDEFAKENKNCLMFTPKHEDELRHCLLNLLDDADLRKRLSEAGRQMAEGFSWEYSAKQLLNIIN